MAFGENDLPSIFERFYQIDKARIRNSGGGGLGLAICREIVCNHAGRIDVASVLGQGTTFTVRVPLRSPGGPLKKGPGLRTKT